MADTGVVNIRGKEYKTVALRVDEFRKHEDFKGFGIQTEVMSSADLVMVKASIVSDSGHVVATGYAEEDRAAGNINKTSAIENAETSAVGRALAFLGFGGTEIASANEVGDAIVQQATKEVLDRVVSHIKAVNENLPSILAIKDGIASGELGDAAEAWFELDNDTKAALFIATTKGGIFTTKEREVMKSAEFRKAYYGENE